MKISELRNELRVLQLRRWSLRWSEYFIRIGKVVHVAGGVTIKITTVDNCNRLVNSALHAC